MKKFLGIVIAAIITFCSVLNVNAVDEEIIFRNETLSNVNKIQNAGTTYKEVTTSEGIKIAYCFNKKLDAPPAGSKLIKIDNSVLPNEARTNQYIYILDNGYGGKWNTAVIGNKTYSNYEKYYITQLALWIAQGSLDANTIKNSGYLGNAAYNLYDAAVKNSTVIKYTPEVNLTGNKGMTLKDGKYVSNEITLTVEGANNAEIMLVNAPAGSEIIVNGTNKGNKTILASGTKFQVSVPADKVAKGLNIKVTANTTAIRKKIQIYKYQGNDDYQNIGLIFKENYKAKNEFALEIAPKGELLVEKVEIVNGTEKKLGGVTLAVLDSKKNVVAKWNTDDENPKTIKNLTIGETYTIVEEVTPSGYNKIADKTVTIKSTETVKVKVVNYKKKTVIISKRDVETDKELPGATLVLKDDKGNVIETWVSGTNPHYISDLPEGNYVLVETISPDGYEIGDGVVRFTIKYDGREMKPIVIYNSKIPETGDINLTLVIVGAILSLIAIIFGYKKICKKA